VIVRPLPTARLPDARLLATNQTSHAPRAAAFGRHWGNADCARPQPRDAVLAAISDSAGCGGAVLQ